MGLPEKKEERGVEVKTHEFRPSEKEQDARGKLIMRHVGGRVKNCPHIKQEL